MLKKGESTCTPISMPMNMVIGEVHVVNEDSQALLLTSYQVLLLVEQNVETNFTEQNDQTLPNCSS